VKGKAIVGVIVGAATWLLTGDGDAGCEALGSSFNPLDGGGALNVGEDEELYEHRVQREILSELEGEMNR
jgi:hypothetical protein